MSAFQTFHLYAGIKIAFGDIYGVVGKFSHRIYAACTSDE